MASAITDRSSLLIGATLRPIARGSDILRASSIACWPRAVSATPAFSSSRLVAASRGATASGPTGAADKVATGDELVPLRCPRDLQVEPQNFARVDFVSKSLLQTWQVTSMVASRYATLQHSMTEGHDLN